MFSNLSKHLWKAAKSVFHPKMSLIHGVVIFATQCYLKFYVIVEIAILIFKGKKNLKKTSLNSMNCFAYRLVFALQKLNILGWSNALYSNYCSSMLCICIIQNRSGNNCSNTINTNYYWLNLFYNLATIRLTYRYYN